MSLDDDSPELPWMKTFLLAKLVALGWSWNDLCCSDVNRTAIDGDILLIWTWWLVDCCHEVLSVMGFRLLYFCCKRLFVYGLFWALVDQKYLRRQPPGLRVDMIAASMCILNSKSNCTVLNSKSYCELRLWGLLTYHVCAWQIKGKRSTRVHQSSPSLSLSLSLSLLLSLPPSLSPSLSLSRSPSLSPSLSCLWLCVLAWERARAREREFILNTPQHSTQAWCFDISCRPKLLGPAQGRCRAFPQKYTTASRMSELDLNETNGKTSQ